jgi:Tfp pilus assembly protein FimT
MHRMKGLAHGSKPSPALVLALLALLAALVAPAWANHQSATMSVASTVTVVKRDGFVSNGHVVELNVPCPSGTKVFSGGVATTGQHTRWIAIGPGRGNNSYLGYASTPVANINAGITRETAHITAVAYCAKTGRAIVM